MSRSLNLADRVSLPLDAVTQTFLVFGKRGSGKSTTAVRMAEQMVQAGLPIAVLDPVDVWWGLKSDLEVYVFGGDHADLPLEPGAGALMADVVVDERINVVMVLRQFSNREKARFVTDFADRLFRRNREVLHLFCEEAHELMPQNPYKGEEEMLGRMLKLQKLGRTSGIGLTSITQRAASLNKNATTQAEIMVLHRVTGPQDIEAMKLWVKYNQGEEKIDEVLASLSSLKTGEGWIWAPGWPEKDPIDLRRIRVFPPETFDSRSTPKAGEKRKAPKSLTPVDLERLGGKIKETVERAKADDPKELRRRIIELESESKVLQGVIDGESKREREQIDVLKKQLATARAIEKPVIKDAQLKRLEAVADRFEKMGDLLKKQAADIFKFKLPAVAARLGQTNEDGSYETKVLTARDLRSRVGSGVGIPAFMDPAITKRPTPRVADGNGFKLNRGMRAILSALAANGGEASRTATATLAGLSPQSGTYANYLSALRTNGYIDDLYGGDIRLLKHPHGYEGERLVRDFDKTALLSLWKSKLHGGARRMFEVLLQTYPGGLSRDGIATDAGLSAESGTFANYLSKLRVNGLIEDRDGLIYANGVFFGRPR